MGKPGRGAAGPKGNPRTVGGQKPSEPDAAGSPGLGAVLAGLAGAGVLVTGAALLIGWKYTEAFYGRLGVPTEALDLEPAAYLTAKIEIWYSLAGAAITAIGAVVAWRLPPPPPPWSFRRWPRMLLIAAGMATFAGGFVAACETGEAGLVYVCGLGITLVFFGISLALQGRVDRDAGLTASIAVGTLVAFIIMLVGMLPEELGQHDAEALLAGPREGSGARLVAAEPLGLPGELVESGSYVTDGVRVVAATNNAYYVVVSGTQTVYGLAATNILRIEYAPGGR